MFNWNARLRHLSSLMTMLMMVQSVLQADGELSLVERPPFRAPSRIEMSSAASQVATEGSINQRLAFAGMLHAGGVQRFSVYDKAKNRPFWVAIGESVEGVKVEAFDATQNGLVVSEDGKKEMLVLRESKSGSGSPNARANLPNHPAMTGIQNYPKAPPNLPRPEKLLEQLRMQQMQQQQMQQQAQ
jgi:hypothetical protein